MRFLAIRLWVCVLLALPGVASARWYDAGTGRFLSEDPRLAEPLTEREDLLRTPMKLQPWQYAAGNPLRYVDPDGREPEMRLAGNEIAAQCALWGDKLDFCLSPEAQQHAVAQLRSATNNATLAGSSLMLAFYTGGLSGVATSWSFGISLDVAQQTYADPSRPTTLDEVDFVGAALRGAQMSALPPAMKGVSSLGAGGKALATLTTLYMSGHALAEGSGQLSQGLLQEDIGRSSYGMLLMFMGSSGAAMSYRDAAGMVPYERLPNWAQWQVQSAGGANGFLLPFPRLNLIKPQGSSSSSARNLSSGARVENPKPPGLLDAQDKHVVKIDTIIQDHAKPHDFEGVLKERRGERILKANGEAWNHQREMIDSIRGLKRSIRALEGSMENPAHPPEVRAYVQEAINRAKATLSRMDATLYGKLDGQ